MTNLTKEFDDGFNAKMLEIREMGFVAARNKFNLDCPVGVKWEGSPAGLEYCKGEMSALEDAISKGLHR